MHIIYHISFLLKCLAIFMARPGETQAEAESWKKEKYFQKIERNAGK